jgi:hypothetical protein
MVLCCSCDGVPLKEKEKLTGLQFTSTDYLSLVLTPLRIRWTIPLRIGTKDTCAQPCDFIHLQIQSLFGGEYKSNVPA